MDLEHIGFPLILKLVFLLNDHQLIQREILRKMVKVIVEYDYPILLFNN